MTEHRHDVAVPSDRPVSDASLTSVVLSTGTEERIVNALLAALRADDD